MKSKMHSVNRRVLKFFFSVFSARDIYLEGAFTTTIRDTCGALECYSKEIFLADEKTISRWVYLSDI